MFQKRSFPDPIELEMIIPFFHETTPQYSIRVVSDTWVGSEFLVPVELHHLLLPVSSCNLNDAIQKDEHSLGNII